MPLTPRQSAAFQNEAFQFIQEGEGFEDRVYDDSIGVPTLGYGYALVTKVNKVWSVKASLVADLAGIGITLTTSQIATLNSIVQALNAGDTTLASASVQAWSSLALPPKYMVPAKHRDRRGLPVPFTLLKNPISLAFRGCRDAVSVVAGTAGDG
jgi:hypothetical protein